MMNAPPRLDLRPTLRTWLGVVFTGCVYGVLLLSVAVTLQKLLQSRLSSDTVYLVTLYRDLFVDRYGLKGWQLTPAPYFFPDMPLLFFCLEIAPDVGLAYVLYAILFYGGAAIAVARILAMVGRRSLAWRLAPVPFLVLIAFQDCSVNRSLATYLFFPSFHAGTLFTGLWLIERALVLAIRGIRVGPCFVYLILAVLGVLSDRLLIPQFLVPILLALMVPALKHRPLWKLVGILTGLTIAACSTVWLFMPLLHQGYFGFTVPKLGYFNAGNQLSDELAGRIVSDLARYVWINERAFLILLMVFTVVLITAPLWFKSVYQRLPDEPNSRRTVVIVCGMVWLVSLFSLVVNAMALPAVGLWFGLSERRFFLPQYVFPAFALMMLGYVVNGMIPRSLRWAGGIVLVMLGVVTLGPEIATLRLDGFRLSYPENVQQLDRLAGDLGLRYGYGDYWSAKSLTVHSRRGLRIAQVYSNLNRHFEISNANWFTRDAIDLQRFPTYQYIVMNGLDRNTVQQRFGDPALAAFCGDLEVWVYNRPGDIVFRNFQRYWAEDCCKPDSPESLRTFKADGTNWDEPGNLIFPAGGEIAIRFNPPACGDTLEISADDNDEYLVEWFGGVNSPDGRRQSLGQTVVPMALSHGLSTRYLTLPETAVGREIPEAVVRPLQGDGFYSLGHFFVYDDRFGAERSTQESGPDTFKD